MASELRVSLDQWQALQAVVEAGGYAQAAARLHKSQSAITYAVQKIETQLKVKLGDGQLTQEAVSKYTIPEALMKGSGEALFDFIADSLDDFLRTKDPAPPKAEEEKVEASA